MTNIPVSIYPIIFFLGLFIVPIICLFDPVCTPFWKIFCAVFIFTNIIITIYLMKYRNVWYKMLLASVKYSIGCFNIGIIYMPIVMGAIYLVEIFYAIAGWRIDMFYDAFLTGNVSLVRETLQRQPSLINMRKETGWAPIHIAALSKNVPLVDFLLKKGAEINMETIPAGLTPLHIATVNNDVQMVQLLLANGADQTIRSNEGHTPYYISTLLYRPQIKEIFEMASGFPEICTHIAREGELPNCVYLKESLEDQYRFGTQL